MSNGSKASYPMLSNANWWKIRDKFQVSLPSKVTPSYLVSLLDLKDDKSATSNVLTPMKSLGLLDEEGQPTELAKAWRLDDSYEEACNDMLERVYPDELLDLLPEKEIDKTIAQNWFMKSGVGKTAAEKMYRLFSLLKESDLSKRNIGSEKKKVTRQAKATTKSRQNEGKPGESESESPSPTVADHSKRVVDPSVHIDLQIHISPESSQDQIEAIFSSMAKYLYRNE